MPLGLCFRIGGYPTAPRGYSRGVADGPRSREVAYYLPILSNVQLAASAASIRSCTRTAHRVTPQEAPETSLFPHGANSVTGAQRTSPPRAMRPTCVSVIRMPHPAGPASVMRTRKRAGVNAQVARNVAVRRAVGTRIAGSPLGEYPPGVPRRNAQRTRKRVTRGVACLRCATIDVTSN